MSWGYINNCYGCLNKECADRESLSKISGVISEIHQNPDHPSKGGYGSVMVNCGKKEHLYQKFVEEHKEG